jgi:hypothetical protein
MYIREVFTIKPFRRPASTWVLQIETDRAVAPPWAGNRSEPQVGGPVQEFSLSSRALEASAAGGGEVGVPFPGIVPPRGFHRDQPHGLKPGGGAVLRFYNKRGTAEQWIKEGKQAVAMTRLSCHRANEVRLWLIAYNLGNLWHRLALPTQVATWSLTSLQQRLVKTGGRLIKHSRYYWLLLAESHLTRRLFGNMLRRIAALPSPAASTRSRFARGTPTASW